MKDSFAVHDTLSVHGKLYHFANLAKLGERFNLSRLPYSMKILLENLLRHEDGIETSDKEIEALASWNATSDSDTEISFMPARVLLQDFTGVPCVVDLAAMRDAMKSLGGDPTLINPLSPAELVIDHSIQVDVFGREEALEQNVAIEFERNQARYSFLRWGQKAFNNFKVVPPRTGIVHQVNLEYLARVVITHERDNEAWIYPDTVFGTDSHTTMINGLGVLGWGVGGIEAEAAMLGQPSSMLIPQVVGFKLSGKLPEGATATDLVLTVTQMLRKQGVVGKFVEFFGSGLRHLTLADRATISNMAPEYGATCGIFPIDIEALKYLRLSGRDEAQITLVETYAKQQGLWHDEATPVPEFSSVLELDLTTVTPSLAGPKRPQDRVLLSDIKQNYQQHLNTSDGKEKQQQQTDTQDTASPQMALRDGAVVIAAITSCTNTSNPAVMLAAGLLAKKAAARDLKAKAWVKTSLAPGSKVVTDYLKKTNLLPELEKIGFYLVGYGCTTCIGNSGPLPTEISQTIQSRDLSVGAVISGNRNFEGRVHPDVKMNYLASPPLVVAYALAGSLDIDLTAEPLGQDHHGKDVFLKDIWPDSQEINDLMSQAINSTMFHSNYADVFQGDQSWNAIASPDGALYAWDPDSTYIKHPPYFDGMTMELDPVQNIHDARCLGLFGDSITTDHISPAGAIKQDSPAGQFLITKGVHPKDFNSYGSRRGNDDVMVRGTFANIRLKNQMLDGVEGGYTRHLPSNQKMSIYDAAIKYKTEKTPLIVLAGKEYGTGSSRDWAAKGTLLLGVKAVIAESFERIHRSNLVGMGVLPLCFVGGQSATSLGLTGYEFFDITGLDDAQADQAKIVATTTAGNKKEFTVKVMLLTPKERDFFRHGGILQYVLRQLAGKKAD